MICDSGGGDTVAGDVGRQPTSIRLSGRRLNTRYCSPGAAIYGFLVLQAGDVPVCTYIRTQTDRRW